jgi:hypothetical protein
VRDVRGLRFGPPGAGRSLEDVLTADHAVALASRHQRRALRDAAAFATTVGEPVGFLWRRGPEGPEFEAVALGSARTCAIVGTDGGLRYVAGGRPRDSRRRKAARAERTGPRRAAERALAAARAR